MNLGFHAIVASADENTTKVAAEVFKHLDVAKSAEELRRLPLTGVKIVLLDMEMPDVSGETVRRVLQEASLVVTSTDLSGPLQELAASAMEWLPKPIRAEELARRVELCVRRRERWVPWGVERSMRFDPVLPYLVKELHNPKTGRLEGDRVAKFFGVSLSELARTLDRPVSTVHKTPAAASLQANLRSLESIASGLVRLTGSPERMRMWLRTAIPALAGHAPIEWLQKGKIGALADFVQDLLEGRPA